MALGKYCNSALMRIGSPHTSITAASLNTTSDAWAGRFIARGTNRDIKGFVFNFSAVTGTFSCQLRVETVSTSTGKPTGTLYDSNATKTFTPTTGYQLVTFDTVPTTHVTAGTAYAIVLKVLSAGTTLTLNSHRVLSVLPVIKLISADGGSTWTEGSDTWPVGSVMLDGDEEVTWGFYPYVGTATTSYPIYGTRAAGITVVNSVPFKLVGVYGTTVLRTGTPTDLRLRVFDSSDSVVTGSTITTDADYLTAGGSKNFLIYFNDILTVPTGTYRYIFDQTDHGSTSGNYYSFYVNKSRNDAVRISSFRFTSTANIEDAHPTWSTHDDDFDEVPIGLIFDDIPTVTGSGGLIVHPGMSGGMRG